MNSAKAVFREYLKEKQLRNTSQRDAVLNALFSTNRHVTAEELFSAIKKKDRGIGLATVHRNLNLLRDCGLAEELKIGNQQAKFEPKLGHEHHDHLICTKCGKLIEVKDARIEKLQDKLAEANDFKPVRHKLEIYGSCKMCR
jgi:Fur family ferric uptake transcriptional regulator